MRCPNCGGRSIGRVGSEQYYCWDCCVEFNTARGAVRIYHLDPGGDLVAAEDYQGEAASVLTGPTHERRR
ncbi:hypothetical protein J2Z79_001708 [Symbiobacterium terraclitae]|uniref:Uncharacterized protein n=1 Tax=Symbiobacterium terraclitae TaxID=557451 RepID=A0ABS4JRZ5_9FIRM|nr:hypothetical protein [Symbiobacterium terraclitae]MBP2018307.1 hypothetical protein [Symbiobacterium terraclitae]